MPITTVVLDTNVLISAILFGGKPRQILQHVIQGKITAFLSPVLFTEFKDVLERPKFGLSREACFAITREIEELFSFVFPEIVIDEVRDDPDDNAVLECALTAVAALIITGDPHLLNLGNFRRIRIISPEALIAEFGSSPAAPEQQGQHSQ